MLCSRSELAAFPNKSVFLLLVSLSNHHACCTVWCTLQYRRGYNRVNDMLPESYPLSRRPNTHL